MTHWTLAHMRDMNEADPLPGLGELKPRAEPEAPKPVRRSDGIVVGADGMWRTDFPEPDPTGASAPPDPPAPPPDEAEPGAHGFIKEGDLVRLLRGHQWFRRLGTGPYQARRIDRGGFFLGSTGGVCLFRNDDWERCAPPTHRTDEVTA